MLGEAVYIKFVVAILVARRLSKDLRKLWKMVLYQRANKTVILLSDEKLVLISYTAVLSVIPQKTMVLPSVMDKDGIYLLTELLQHWKNYKMMTNCLALIFHYLDRQIQDREIGIPRFVDISFRSFHELVLIHIDQRLIRATASTITEQRNGVQIDDHLLPSMTLLFLEFGNHGYKAYYSMFEEEIIRDASRFFSDVASVWFPVYSSSEYVLKVEQCLVEEHKRATEFLRQSSIRKLLQGVHSEMLEQYEDKLAKMRRAEKEDSTLLQDVITRCSKLSLG